MAISQARRVGKPRMDPVQRVLHRFYEPLILLSTLNPQTDSFPASLGSVQRANDFLVLWKDFLDTLAWFGDFDHGGRSVTAVAAQHLAEGPCYWVAARCQKSQLRIYEIVQQLRTIADLKPAARDQLITQITESAIRFASKKVKKYAKELSHFFEKAPKSNGSPAFLEMIQSLRNMTQLSGLELCKASVAFTHSDYLSRLVRSTTKSRQPSPWSPVRHFVKRLQSWHNRAASLVEFAEHNEQFFEHVTCQWLPLPQSVSLPKADEKTNLPSIFGRMLPSQQQEEVSRLYEAVKSLEGIDLEQDFLDHYTNENLALLVHAETYLLEYFYFNEMEFVEQYKYIGASKPSCYCCDLYMRFHPGNFMTRASHGMAWSTWSPPLIHDSQDQAKLKHSMALLGDVTNCVRRDVLTQIRERMPRQRRQPDSTSGRFSSLR